MTEENIENVETIEKRIAVYETSYGSQIIINAEYDNSEYTRLSEITTVVFKKRPQEEIIQAKVVTLTNEIESLKEETLKKIQTLEEKKKELLALTAK